MENVIIISLAISLFYVFVKVIEMKFIDKEWKPAKQLIKDSLIVLGCSIAATTSYYFLEQNINEFFNVVTDSKIITPGATQIFTDEPNF
jgi:hypothetical protein